MSHRSIGWALPSCDIAAGNATDRQFHSSRRSRWLITPLQWIERSRQRRQLGELVDLNDYLLRDIGVSLEEARREATKPFWQ